MREVQRVLKVLAVLVPMVLVGCAPPADEPSAGPATAAPASEAAGGPMIDLPKQVGPWERADSPKRITAATILDYMNGGGELYLAYRFNHLYVLEYKAADASLGTILVGVFGDATYGGMNGLINGGGFKLLGIQALGALVVFGWVAVTAGILCRVIKKTIGLRVSREEQLKGLDIEEHGMESYSGFQIFRNQ